MLGAYISNISCIIYERGLGTEIIESTGTFQEHIATTSSVNSGMQWRNWLFDNLKLMYEPFLHGWMFGEETETIKGDYFGCTFIECNIYQSFQNLMCNGWEIFCFDYNCMCTVVVFKNFLLKKMHFAALGNVDAHLFVELIDSCYCNWDVYCLLRIEAWGCYEGNNVHEISAKSCHEYGPGVDAVPTECKRWISSSNARVCGSATTWLHGTWSTWTAAWMLDSLDLHQELVGMLNHNNL